MVSRVRCPETCICSSAPLGGKSSQFVCHSSLMNTYKHWNGTFFEPMSLKALGLHVQLGHLPGQTCGNPRRAFNGDFTVMDTHGIHNVAVDYCDCENAKSLVHQLLRVSWFPATTTHPRSATTFRLLREFQLLSFESKVSAYEFYQSLAHNSDNNGIIDIKVISISCLVT